MVSRESCRLGRLPPRYAHTDTMAARRHATRLLQCQVPGCDRSLHKLRDYYKVCAWKAREDPHARAVCDIWNSHPFAQRYKVRAFGGA